MRILIVLFLLFCFPAWGADANGYTAEYECRDGGTKCNVDVVTLTTTACDATYSVDNGGTTITSWSQINQSLTYICLLNDDYTSLGTLTLTTDGTSGTRKVLRYTRTGDNDDEPWNQSAANKAVFSSIDVAGSFWIIHRISVVPTTAPGVNLIQLDGTNNILNRTLVVGPHNTGSGVGLGPSASNTTIQNNLIYELDNSRSGDLDGSHGINATGGTDVHIVNNELYDWQAHNVQVGTNSNPSMPGYVIENNDFYITAAVVQPSGEALAKSTMSLKATATSGNPAKVIHNRFWNSRKSVYSGPAFICCSPGMAINVVTPIDFLLIQNNIITESQGGISWAFQPSTRNSVIGNIIYKTTDFVSGGFSFRYGIDFEQQNTGEVYFNTLIDNAENFFGNVTTADIRCNVFISENNTSGAHGANDIMDFNVFYDTTTLTFNGTNTNINKALNTRANSTGYTAGAIMRTTATPPADGTAGDFLRVALNSGTSAGSPPTFCTRLNCQTKDNNIWWKAIRGPLVHKRKLRTVAGGETFYIPYARSKNDSDLPEFNSCPSNFADRAGIGIHDLTGFSSFSPDIRGVAR